jgi:putative transposase
MLLENSIIEPANPDVTWFPGRSIYLGIDQAGQAVVMPLLDQQKGPQVVSLDELQVALGEGELRIDACSRPAARNPADLSEAARKEYDFWEGFFESAVTGEQRDTLLEAGGRARLIEKIARKSGRPLITVRRMLYKVLRAGRHLHGLCMDYNRRGGRGLKQKPGTNKRGRKPNPGSIAGERPAADFRGRIEDSVSSRVIAGKETIPEAYRKMLAESFMQTTVAANGKIKREELPESQRPTLKQFRVVALEMQHKGVRKTRLKSVVERAGSAKDGVPGPGYRYEIDATGGQLELVSEFDLGQAIGPANAYGLLDVWSTVCVGGAMGVFSAGYKAAQMALFNTFTSKKELCARWNVEIEDEIWPCHHVPRFITSDRGELVSDAAEALPAEFNTIMQTASPYVPEMKGTIEGWFNGLKSGDIRKLVGYGKKMGRMQRDPKRDAALTRYDVMRAFLLLAIRYNHQAAPVSAIPPQMIEQGYERISRITLWQWGLRNLTPYTRIEDPGFVYTSLLRKVDASIRENGLFVEGIRYMSPELRVGGHLKRAAEYGAIQVQATVDDYLANTVWFRTDMDAPWQPAYLADEKLKVYNATFGELADYYRKVKVVNERSKISGSVLDLDTEKGLSGISAEAVERKKQLAQRPKSRTPKNVRAARTADAQSERQDHGTAVMRSFANASPATSRRAKSGKRTAGPQETLSKSRLDMVKASFLKQGT